MKEKKTNKMKVWFEEHKDELKSDVIKLGCYALGFGLGYFVADKISDLKYGAGIQIAHQVGFIKFFNPSTGLEVGAEEVSKLMREYKPN